MIDYPDAKGLQGIAANMYDAGDITSAVGHGGAIFLGIVDPKTGKSIIAGKKVTGSPPREKRRRARDDQELE